MDEMMDAQVFKNRSRYSAYTYSQYGIRRFDLGGSTTVIILG
jgi:hypothetical protein